MERDILFALHEIEDKQFFTLAEALEEYTEQEIFDLWLKYEGISGYTTTILEVIRELYNVQPK